MNRQYFTSEFEFRTVAIVVSAIGIGLISAFFISIGVYQASILPLGVALIVFMLAYFKGEAGKRRVEGLVALLCLMYIVSSLVWPRYVALWIPGLPSINIQRIAGALAVISMGIGFLVSENLRLMVYRSFGRAKFFWIFFSILVLFRFISVFVSRDIAFSLYRFVNDFFVHWVFIFAGVFIGDRFKNLDLFLKVIVFCFFTVFSIGVVEYSLNRNLFSQFVDPSSDYVRAAAADKVRDGVYRVQSTFGHPLALAEFASVGFCLVISFFLERTRGLTKFISVGATVFCAAALVIMANSRAGYGAVAVAASLLVFSSLLRGVFTNSMTMRSATSWSLLFGVVVFIAGYVGYSAYDSAFGSKAYTSSNTARMVMLERGLEKLVESPVVGHGVGIGVELVGTPSAASSSGYSIDSLYISYMVDSGLFAVVSFCFLLILGAVKSFRIAMNNKLSNWFIWYALAVSVVSFSMFKTILSLPDNNFLLFILLGIIVSRLAEKSGGSSSTQESVRSFGGNKS